MNIKFSYLYRDSGNYKNYGEAIFQNSSNISFEEAKSAITKALISGEYFYAEEWGLPDLHFDKWNPELDHGFHEYESITETSEDVNQSADLSEFLKMIASQVHQ